jgi:tRNA (guanine26-N2/guanine27-N2)-dimethyltransferase
MTKTHSNVDFPTETITEGKAKLLVPKLKAYMKLPSDYAPSKAPVFYNPVMELNRDFAVLALQAYQRMVKHEISVCEPLAGCGIRGIRLAKEVEGVQKVLMNDINERAFKIASYNVQMNKLSKCVVVKNEDANHLLAQYSAPHKRFDAVDIDPFGSPVPYLDSAIRALRNNGLLALTATDMAPLCGVHSKACVRKYGGKPLRTEYCHELAVRLLAGCLATTAAKQDIGVDIIFSYSANHYVRVYATIRYGAKKADESIQNMGYILHCFKCLHRETAKEFSFLEHPGKCSECGAKLNVAGPLWLGKIFDKEFCELMEEIANKKDFRLASRISKILSLIKDEAEAPITYHVCDELCHKLNLPAPAIAEVVEALRNAGFRAYVTHFNSKGIRTDASAMEIRELLQRIFRG